MRDLLSSLLDHDLGHLRIVAELWGLDLPPGGVREAAPPLVQAMLERTLLSEVVESLPAAARQALDALLAAGGRLPLSDLSRRFGPLRAMGPGRRDREKPWRDPASPLEALWYRGLIDRAFGQGPHGPLEYAYVPRDLLALLPVPQETLSGVPGRPAADPPHKRLARTFAVDDATTLLAALRRNPAPGRSLPPDRTTSLRPFLLQPGSLAMLTTLLLEGDLLQPDPLRPLPQAVRTFLDAPRRVSLQRLIRLWVRSRDWNDLQALPHLEAPSGWPNDPLAGRQAVLDLLRPIPPGTWWDLDTFLQAVRDRQPAFQRPAGDFDSWYLRDRRTGAFLRGFEHWDAVEGELLRFLITGPLHWLGLCDLGTPDPEAPPNAFRLTPLADLLHGEEIRQAPSQEAEVPARVGPDGLLLVPRTASRALRYQIARLGAWVGLERERYAYRLTPGSLQRASQQGLQVAHVRAVLEQVSGEALPPPLAKALARWAEHGVEARLERLMILRVRDPQVLKDLQSQRATARYLGEPLGPTAAVVRERDWKPLLEAAARQGLLLDPPTPEDWP